MIPTLEVPIERAALELTHRLSDRPWFAQAVAGYDDGPVDLTAMKAGEPIPGPTPVVYVLVHHCRDRNRPEIPLHWPNAVAGYPVLVRVHAEYVARLRDGVPALGSERPTARKVKGQGRAGWLGRK